MGEGHRAGQAKALSEVGVDAMGGKGVEGRSVFSSPEIVSLASEVLSFNFIWTKAVTDFPELSL